MAYVLILAILLFRTCFASSPCCPNGNNEIRGKTCADGSSVAAPTCLHKYLTANGPGISIDENDNLNIATSHIPPDRYCASQSNGTDIFLVCFSEELNHTDTIFTVHAIFELISVVFLVITILVYFQVPGLLELQDVCILHSLAGLAVGFVLLAFIQLSTATVSTLPCISLAYLIYFSTLYAFFWLNVLALHIWRTTVKPRFLNSCRCWPHIYYSLGCGGPTVLLIILIIAHSMEQSDIHPGFGENKCWFKTEKAQVIYFYAPMACLLCSNIIYCGWTIAVLWRNLSNTDEKKTKVLKYRLLLCLKLFFIMGLSWIFELLSVAFQNVHPVLQIIWNITDSVNTLQGIPLFLILVVFRKRVVRGLAGRTVCGVRLPGRWRAAADDECEEIEEELDLSEAQSHKT